MYGVEILTAPSDDPLDAEDLRAYLRLNSDAEDDLLTELIQAAAERFEQDTRRPVLATTYRQYVSRWTSPLVLGRGGVTAVEAVELLDADGEVIEPITFKVDLKTPPARIFLPDAQPVTWSPAGQVDFVAGWETPADVPKNVLVALRGLVAHWYEHREAYHAGQALQELPQGWQAVCRKYMLGLSGDWGQ